MPKRGIHNRYIQVNLQIKIGQYRRLLSNKFKSFIIFDKIEHNQYHDIPGHKCSDNFYGQISGSSFTEAKNQCSEDPECAMFEEVLTGTSPSPTGTYRFCTEGASLAGATGTYDPCLFCNYKRYNKNNIYVKGE